MYRLLACIALLLVGAGIGTTNAEGIQSLAFSPFTENVELEPTTTSRPTKMGPISTAAPREAEIDVPDTSSSTSSSLSSSTTQVVPGTPETTTTNSGGTGTTDTTTDPGNVGTVPPTEVSPSTIPDVTISIPEITTTLPVVTLPELPENPIDSEFLDETNEVRGIDLTWSNELAAYARVHLRQMMVADELFHSNIGRLLTHWSVVGENVGVGPTVDDIQNAYMASPTHAENVTHPAFTHFGSASETGLDGRIWTVEIFGTK